MNIETYKVDYKEYHKITEPKIYIWREQNTGRIIGRIFNTGKNANACRIAYGMQSNQTISWCMGVFPIDIDRDFIRNWYPTIEFQDELAEEGRKKRGKDKKPRHRRTKAELLLEKEKEIPETIGAKIPRELKNRLDEYSLSTGKMQKDIIVEALDRFLQGKEEIIKEIRHLQKLL